MGDLRRWAFAAFHAAILVAVAVLAGHLTIDLGDPLAGLSTLLGLGLYALFWLLLWVVTGRAFAAASPSDASLRELLVAGAGYGGATGVGVVLVVVGGGGALAALVSGGNPLTFLLFGLFGSLVAAVVGALLGVGYALLDAALVRVGERLVPPAG